MAAIATSLLESGSAAGATDVKVVDSTSTCRHDVAGAAKDVMLIAGAAKDTCNQSCRKIVEAMEQQKQIMFELQRMFKDNRDLRLKALALADQWRPIEQETVTFIMQVETFAKDCATTYLDQVHTSIESDDYDTAYVFLEEKVEHFHKLKGDLASLQSKFDELAGKVQQTKMEAHVQEKELEDFKEDLERRGAVGKIGTGVAAVGAACLAVNPICWGLAAGAAGGGLVYAAYVGAENQEQLKKSQTDLANQMDRIDGVLQQEKRELANTGVKLDEAVHKTQLLERIVQKHKKNAVLKMFESAKADYLDLAEQCKCFAAALQPSLTSSPALTDC